MVYFASQQRIANISENITCTVFPNFVLQLWASEANLTGVGIRHTTNGVPMHAEFHYRFNNVHSLSDIS